MFAITLYVELTWLTFVTFTTFSIICFEERFLFFCVRVLTIVAFIAAEFVLTES